MHAGARHEWRKYWTLAIAAALGNSVTVLHIYSIGPFMEPLQREFAWSRAQISFGLTVAAGCASIMGIGVGMLVDRWGPRRVGLVGVVGICSAYALLGTANGMVPNWLILWALIGMAAAWVNPTIWTSAIASRFDSSRGLAIAVTISGSGVAAAVIPVLATWLIANYGWRSAFFGMGALWALILLPFLALFFHGKQDRRASKPAAGQVLASDLLTGLTLAEGLRSPAFYKLAIAGMVFAFAIIGLIVHFVPILHDLGLNRLTAASIAGLVGLSSIAGRLGTGFLIDRFRADRVAMFAFLLPVVSASLLLSGGGPVVLAIAALVVGLSLGSELDVILYLATRHLGLKRFGVLFALMLIALSLGTALGPVCAGALFDHFGTYWQFILTIFPLVIFGSVLVGSLGPYPDHGEPVSPAES